VQKDSPYLGVFNYFIKEMREKGTLQQIQKKYDPPDQVRSTCQEITLVYKVFLSADASSFCLNALIVTYV
jgi:hypothetical protein